MRCGVILPGGTAPQQLEQAILAEQAGWDGVFVWEAASGVDAWSLLAAIAAATTRIRIGTMLTPLPWRRPWKVASQVATVDQLSGGRTVLGVGVGALTTDLPITGEVTDVRDRAAMMDDGIDLIRALWAGGTSYHGPRYDYEVASGDLAEVGRPVQQRIPIWVVAVWPRLRRTRWPEPATVGGWAQGVPLAELRALCEYWADGYDWHAAERRLNRMPQFRTTIDGLGIHFVHARSPHPDAVPLVLTHGWPHRAGRWSGPRRPGPC